MPVVAIFFPLPVAIGLTAVVHLFQNLLKVSLLWPSIAWSVVIRFGGAALIAVLPGAWLLRKLSQLPPIEKYAFGEISVLHLCIGLLLILFATREAFPTQRFQAKNLFVGGALSGFFGGLTGNQGAFRSAFLIQSNLSKESFIGTGALIASIIDIARLMIYGLSFGHLIEQTELPLLVALGGSLGGVYLGKIFLQKVSLRFMQKAIIALLYALGLLIAAGVI